jgi:hypothetical protein
LRCGISTELCEVLIINSNHGSVNCHMIRVSAL